MYDLLSLIPWSTRVHQINLSQAQVTLKNKSLTCSWVENTCRERRQYRAFTWSLEPKTSNETVKVVTRCTSYFSWCQLRNQALQGRLQLGTLLPGDTVPPAGTFCFESHDCSGNTAGTVQPRRGGDVRPSPCPVSHHLAHCLPGCSEEHRAPWRPCTLGRQEQGDLSCLKLLKEYLPR